MLLPQEGADCEIPNVMKILLLRPGGQSGHPVLRAPGTSDPGRVSSLFLWILSLWSLFLRERPGSRVSISSRCPSGRRLTPLSSWVYTHEDRSSRFSRSLMVPTRDRRRLPRTPGSSVGTRSTF